MAHRNVLGKVTCFITRERDKKMELLLFQHPNAGIQIPAGTVEMNEDFRQAAFREAYEETGINDFLSSNYIGKQEINFSDDKYVIYQNARVYSRPELTSFNWAEIRRGITVQHERKHGEFVQISYIEEDKYPEPNYISYQITGWVHKSNLASTIERHYYHLHTNSTLDLWEHEADNHTLKLFWSSLENIPDIVYPQNEWLKFMTNDLDYTF